MPLPYFVLTLVGLLPIAASLGACRQTFGSNTYDLNGLSHVILSGGDKEFRYLLTPCGLVPTEQCGKKATPFEEGMMACQERIAGPSFESPMAFLDGYGKSPNLGFTENPQGRGTGIVMIARNALCNGRERLVNVTFICDKSVKNPSNMDVVEGPTCQFAITVKASQACPIKASVTGGTIFLIILLVPVIVYLIVGVSYNRFVKQETGLAILPHPTFWLLIIGLFTTGCRFCVSFVLSCFRGTPSMSLKEYQSM